jgi:hypothetical protein
VGFDEWIVGCTKDGLEFRLEEGYNLDKKTTLFSKKAFFSGSFIPLAYGQVG